MDKIDELLTRGVEKVIPTKEDLEKVLRSGKKLRVYQGFDPTSPNLHIGHLVGLRKLKQWQDLGHEVIFLIGDFTAAVGDPTGKDKTRPMLSETEILANTKTYQEQASKVLDFSGPNPVKLKRNSEWLAKLSSIEFARLAANMTVQQVIERDMFQKRFKEGSDVAISEFFYPIMQGYDSIAMDVDVEIGGNDQLFNMMTGRDLMHKIKRKNKFVMTTTLITDSNGKKIGKSEGNAIGITLPPETLFGMIMTLDDSVLIKCFECITTLPLDEVAQIKKELDSGKNPMVVKKTLAHQIVKELSSDEAAAKAQQHFENTFQKQDMTAVDVPEFKISNLSVSPIAADALLVEINLSASKSEAKRLLKENAVELDGKSVVENEGIELKFGDLLKVGKKRFLRFV